MAQTFTKRFRSPINEDNGVTNHFIGHALSDMEFTYFPKLDVGTILWNFKFVDGSHKNKSEHIQIDLHFNHKRLVHFEGVHELCEEAIALLEENGFDATYAKV